MKFWNFIGELAFFRWLFGDDKEANDNDPKRKSINTHMYSSNSYRSSRSDWKHQSFNDFHEEQDDYDMMDDF